MNWFPCTPNQTDPYERAWVNLDALEMIGVHFIGEHVEVKFYCEKHSCCAKLTNREYAQLAMQLRKIPTISEPLVSPSNE